MTRRPSNSGPRRYVPALLKCWCQICSSMIAYVFTKDTQRYLLHRAEAEKCEIGSLNDFIRTSRDPCTETLKGASYYRSANFCFAITISQLGYPCFGYQCHHHQHFLQKGYLYNMFWLVRCRFGRCYSWHTARFVVLLFFDHLFLLV